jgi:hypothetical protein
MSLRQALPIVIGVLFLTVMLMVQLPLIGLLGPLAGCIVSFGRWHRAPLFEAAVPGVTMTLARWRKRSTWTRSSLIGSDSASIDDLPAALSGLELLDVADTFLARQRSVGVVADRRAGSLSVILAVRGSGFPVASLAEQDALVGVWGSALAPLARARCLVSRVTWQEWTHPVGMGRHRQFLESVRAGQAGTSAVGDYEQLLVEQSPFTIAHEVLLTITADLRRVRARRGVGVEQLAVDGLIDEVRQLAARLETAGLSVPGPLSPAEIAEAVRSRSDPTPALVPLSAESSLAVATRRHAHQWGPMAVEQDWLHVRVDGSTHRSYFVASWPMLPVRADWMGPLLTVDGATRTVTIVMEPVALTAAAQDANRQLTSIEADQQQKERHGFRLTARERRRHDDVEAREHELAEGHPLFRHVGLVTVTAPNLDLLEDAAATVEQAAAQSMLDLRPLAARQSEGWVASLPLGRSVRRGKW